MLLCDFICFGYGHVFMITVLACHILSLGCFIFIWSAVEIWLLSDWHGQDGSAAQWGRQCRPVLYQPESCVLELIKSVICITFIPMTLCSALHSKHGCRGRFPITPKMWIMASYARLRIQISIHIFRGRLLHQWFENLSLDFISFISSNWVVINYQKGGDCKCNQALLWVLALMTTKLED